MKAVSARSSKWLLGRGFRNSGHCCRAGRLNEPRAVLVEQELDGAPRRVNRRTVALVREEWRVVDRWWTEEPVQRRYFDVVLDGESARSSTGTKRPAAGSASAGFTASGFVCERRR